MSDFTPTEKRRLIRMVNRYAAGRGRLIRGASGFLRRIFQAAPESQLYSGDGVREFVDQAVAQSEAAQGGMVELTDAYLDWVLNDLGADDTGKTASVGSNPRGVDPAAVWERPVVQYRYARSRGADREDSLDAAFARIDALADGDVRLAEREATRVKLESVPEVRGYRRMVHPELSETGSCGLCVAAADQFYSVKELLPIHPHCQCTVLPVVTGRFDPKAYSMVAYGDVIALADSTSAADLAKVRIQVIHHSELGPTLTYAHGSERIERLLQGATPTAA